MKFLGFDIFFVDQCNFTFEKAFQSLHNYWYSITLVNKKNFKAKKFHISLILGRWFRIWQSFLNLWSRFCSVASFAFFGRKLHFRKYFEVLKKKLNFSFLIWMENRIISSLTKKSQNWQYCKIGSINLKMIVRFGISAPKLGKYDTF